MQIEVLHKKSFAHCFAFEVLHKTALLTVLPPFICPQSTVCPVLRRRKAVVDLTLVPALTQLPGTSLEACLDTTAAHGKVWPHSFDLEKQSQQCPHQAEVTCGQCSIVKHTTIYVVAKCLPWKTYSIANSQSVEKGHQYHRGVMQMLQSLPLFWTKPKL